VALRAPELLMADSAVLRLLEGDELVAGAVSGESASVALETRLPSTARLAGDAVQSRAPVAVADAREDQRLLQADPVLGAGYAGYLGVPLVGAQGTVHGVLSVYSRAPRQWREEEIEALGAFAGNASAALSSAELYQSVALEKERSVAFRDISAERVVEQMKSEFVSSVSRELRSPLTSIYGFAETLLRDDVLFGEEERTTFLGYIASEAGRLTAIVDRLLSVARLDSGDLQVTL